jgi:pimeloyl-ACP methyl ester carboxylesterase
VSLLRTSPGTTLALAVLLASMSRAAEAAPGIPRIADSSDQVHIQYTVYGQGDPAVVLIHGWSCDSGYWRAQIDPLAARYTVVTLDLAGHGGSGRNRTDWSMPRYGADVAAVVRQLPNARVILVGHSMGGPVALEAAAILGPRVAGIIGIDTFKSIGLPPPSPPMIDAQIAPFRKDFAGAMHQYVPQFLFKRQADPALVRTVADAMSREPPAIAVASLIALNQMDFAAILPRVHAPIVAINSDLGQITDEARIRKVIPDFRVTTLKGSGHFPMLEQPQRFNAILLQQLAQLAAHQSLTSKSTP